MDWSDVAETVGKIAPAAGGALYGPLGAAVGSVIADQLGVEQSPEAVSQAVNADPEAPAKLKAIEADLERAHITARTARLGSVNETMRAEVDSDSTLKAGWRGAVGWTFALSCLGVMASVVWAMFQPGSDKAELINSALVIFGIMAAVLGIDINRVGKERLAARGVNSGSFMDAVKARVAGK
ncbi:3TM-type holin [Halomonas elongata]|uniref:3TM-type holin n=1 Tax=Halomonas elongata TaxID=2746 RepID=UPI00255ADBBE|nr:3TM-type holin [Halomonas elongata]MDL4861435.1 3TM-type holin [Halomonas elongata]